MQTTHSSLSAAVTIIVVGFVFDTTTDGGGDGGDGRSNHSNSLEPRVSPRFRF
jgi:hypothetical protein